MIKLYNPSKKVKSFNPILSNRIYENGTYFALGETEDGYVMISENSSLETMGLAQNWSCYPDDVIYD